MMWREDMTWRTPAHMRGARAAGSIPAVPLHYDARLCRSAFSRRAATTTILPTAWGGGGGKREGRRLFTMSDIHVLCLYAMCCSCGPVVPVGGILLCLCHAFYHSVWLICVYSPWEEEEVQCNVF